MVEKVERFLLVHLKAKVFRLYLSLEHVKKDSGPLKYFILHGKFRIIIAHLIPSYSLCSHNFSDF